MVKLFVGNNTATVNISNVLSSPEWLRILEKAIPAGNSVHDSVPGGEAMHYSVLDAVELLNVHIGKTIEDPPEMIGRIKFTNEDPGKPQSSLSFYLDRLSRETSNTAAIVVVNGMSICFVARGGNCLCLTATLVLTATLIYLWVPWLVCLTWQKGSHFLPKLNKNCLCQTTGVLLHL